MSRFGWITGILFFGIIMTSCQSPQGLDFRSVANTKLSNVTFEKATLSSDLTFYNPNNFGLELNRTDLDIFIDNNLLGHAAQNLQVQVPARKEFVIPLSMDVDIKNLYRNGLTSLMSKEVTIRALGSVKVGKFGAYKSFPVDYTTKQSFSFFN